MNTGNNALYIARRADARMAAAVGDRVEGRAETSARRDRAASTKRGRGGRRTARCACATTRASGTCATSCSPPRRSRSRCSSRSCRGAARSTVAASFLFTRRGLAHAAARSIRTRAIRSGSFSRSGACAMSSDVVVYPRILADDAARERFRAAAGEQSAAEPARRGQRDPLVPRVRARRFAPPRALEEVREPRPLDHEADRRRGRRSRCTWSSIRTSRATATEESFEEMIAEAATFVYHAARAGSRRDAVAAARHAARARARGRGAAVPRAGAARAGRTSRCISCWSATRCCSRCPEAGMTRKSA